MNCFLAGHHVLYNDTTSEANLQICTGKQVEQAVIPLLGFKDLLAALVTGRSEHSQGS